MSKTNLLTETIEVLTENEKSVEDVAFVCNGRCRMSFHEFAAIAADFNYDDGYGGNKVEGTLKIVGSDWWLERGEYDGSEWWEFKTLPVKPEIHSAEIEDLRENRGRNG